MGSYRPLEDERNYLAHGCFGICPDNPTILFWVAADDYVRFQREVLPREARGEIADDRHAELKKKMYGYRVLDLEALYNHMEKFWWAIFYFNGYLADPSNPLRIQEFDRLRGAL